MEITYKDIAMALPDDVKARAMADAKASLADGEKVTYSLILANVTDDEYDAAVAAAERGEKATPAPSRGNAGEPEGHFNAEMTDEERATSESSLKAWAKSLSAPKKAALIAAAVALLGAVMLAIAVMTAPKQEALSAQSLEGSYSLSKVVMDGASIDFRSWEVSGRQDDESAKALRAFESAPLTVSRSDLKVIWQPLQELKAAVPADGTPRAVGVILEMLSDSTVTESSNGQTFISDPAGNRVEIIFDEESIIIDLTPFFTDYNDKTLIMFSRVDEMDHQARLTAYNELTAAQKSQAAAAFYELLTGASRLGTPLGSSSRLGASVQAAITTAGSDVLDASDVSDVSEAAVVEDGVDDGPDAEADAEAALVDAAPADGAVDATDAAQPAPEQEGAGQQEAAPAIELEPLQPAA